MAEPVNSRNHSVNAENLPQDLHEALLVFASPECLEDSDCVTVDFKDFLQDSFQKDPQKRLHLAQGFNRLVDAYRFVSASPFKPQSGADQKILYEIYFAGVKEELKKGGVGGAVFGSLEFFKMGLEAGHIPTQESAKAGLEGIILGYTLYLQERYDLELNWGEIKERVKKKIEIKIETLPQEPKKETVPTNVIPTGDVIPANNVIPTKVGIQKTVQPRDSGFRRNDVRKTFPPIPKVGIPAAKILPFNETDVVLRKKRDLEILTTKTGGQLQDVITPCEGIEAIQRSLTLKTEKKDYQVMFLIDASGSMQDDVEELKKKMGDLMAHATGQLGPKGQVSFGVRYYVDQISERPTPLDDKTTLDQRRVAAPLSWSQKLTKFVKGTPPADLPKEVQEAKVGLSKAIEHIKTKGGGDEYHWDVAMESLAKDPWVSSDDVEKVIFLLTDEEGNISTTKHTAATVATEANKKGIRFEVIRVLEKNNFYMVKYKNMTLEEAQKALSYSFLSIADNEERGAAIWKLGNTGSSRFVPYLVRAIDAKQEPFSENRRLAAEALGNIGDPRAIPHLAKALEAEGVEGNDRNAAIAMAVSLGQLGDFRGPSRLGQFYKEYKNNDGDFRAKNVLEALGKTRHPLAVPYLIDAFKNTNQHFILIAAREALHKLWELALPEMVKALQDPAFKNAPGRKYLGEALLSKAINHPNILQLFNIGNPLDATKEPDDTLRWNITRELMLQEDPAYLQILTVLQNDRNERVRSFAKDGIRRIKERPQTPR